MYRDQADELDQITKRISALVKVLKWRGIRPAQIAELDKLAEADDGDLIPSETAAAVLAMGQTGGDMSKAIWLMPIEKLILVIRELVAQREITKQIVFEISGLSDVLRGATDPNETLGAQQLKAQFGSMRTQQRQREVQRFARDLMRIKADIIGGKFSTETLSLVTGIQLPTVEQKQAAQAATEAQEPPPEAVQVLQLPTWDEVRQVMGNDALRSFRVDIESDSTIAADLSKAQQNMSAFVEGLASFFAAIGPGVQSGDIPKDVATDLLTGFARSFKLGKQAEDALERLGQQPQQDGPDPAALKAQVEQQAEEAERQADQEKAQAEADLKRAVAAEEMSLKRDLALADADLKKQAFALDSKIKMLENGITSEGVTGLEDVVSMVQEGLAGLNETIRQFQEQASAPVELTPIRENGRLVGATRRQGNSETQVTLN